MATDGEWARRSVSRAEAPRSGGQSLLTRMFDAVGVGSSELLDQLISSALHNQR